MRRTVLVFFILCYSWSQAFAQAPDPVAGLCTPPTPGPGVLKYSIDLTNGATQGNSRYRTEDEVQIVLEHKNPFLFEYRSKIEEQAIPEPALALFFKVFSTSPTATLLSAVAPAPGTGHDLSDSSGNPRCASATSKAETLRKDYESVRQQGVDIVTLMRDLKAAIELDEGKLKDASIHCRELVGAASEIVSLIQKGFDESTAGSLEQKLKQFGVAYQALETERASLAPAIEALRGASPACSAVAVFDEVQNNKMALDQLAKDFEAATNEAKAAVKVISAALQSPQNFYEIRQVGNYDEITVVTVTVERKAKGDAAFPSLPYIVKKLRFGGRQRFALSAGASFSPLETRTFKVVQGIALDASGNPVTPENVTRIVGLDEDSSQRVSPLIILHTRIAEGSKWNSGYHFSFGFAGATANNGLNLEYLIGPSISFAEERFFLTFGAYNGRTEQLQKGFFIGKPIPASVPDVPVVRGRSWDWGFAATYKFR